MRFVFILLSIISLSLTAQNTVGLLSFDDNLVSPGYNLIFPHRQSTVFLLNNCGEIVHTWTDEPGLQPGNSVYLTHRGELIKTKTKASSMNSPIFAGGAGETVEIRSWENELLASYTLNDENRRLHHDIAPMPNGHILLIAWDRKDLMTSYLAGRDTSLLQEDEVWSEAILEWDPLTNQIVWEWNVWDHLIQDRDSTLNNYGDPGANPRRINVNYDLFNGDPDWLHINSIDYNPILDQIIVSVPHFNEFWIIDHHLSTDEAKTEKGDLLMRWGNDKAFDNNSQRDQFLYFQHDVHWVNPLAQAGDDDFGKLGLFNNRVRMDLSTVNFLDTDPALGYPAVNGGYEPSQFSETIVHPTGDQRATSSIISGVQRLPNDNLLICSGRWGYSYELSPDHELVWEYVTPLIDGMPVRQGTNIGVAGNLTFRMTRYHEDFEGFKGRDLSSKGYIELEPNESFCDELTPTEEFYPADNWTLYPNPADDRINLRISSSSQFHENEIVIYDLLGRVRMRRVFQGTDFFIHTAQWNEGVYIAAINKDKLIKFIVHH